MLETIYLPITFVISIFEDFRGYLSVPYDQSPGLDFMVLHRNRYKINI